MAATARLTYTGHNIFEIGNEYLNKDYVRIISVYKNAELLVPMKDYINAGPIGIKMLIPFKETDIISARVLNKTVGNKIIGKYR